MSMTAVLFSFSGHRKCGKTTIYQRVEDLFLQQHSDPKVIFLGNVLGDLPPTGDDDATSILLAGWTKLNEACVRKVKNAVDAAEVVVVDQFGLDVYLNAVACRDCTQQQKEAFELHHQHIVPARIVTKGIKPPIYFIRDYTHADAVAFLYKREEEEIRRYFAPGTGQNPPIYLTGSNVEECAEQALTHILATLQQVRTASCA
jgi:hypothetical protein